MRSVFAEARSGAATLRQPALARTLSAIADRGWREFYAGDTGAGIATFLSEIGSCIDHDDLERFTVEQTAPLTGRFRDLTLLTSPPNSSGVLLLQALAALDAAGTATDWLGAGAGRLAGILHSGSAQRSAILADPRRGGAHIDDWLGEHRIAELVATALTDRPTADALTGATGDTVAIVAADHDGLAVSLIQSLFGSFGACVLDPETGVLFHNRGSSFSLEPGHPNELAGSVRPAHTLLPVVVERDGELAGVLGTMGGTAHAQILAQVLLELLAGSDAARAVASPRWVLGGLDPGSPDTTIIAESGVRSDACRSLSEAGFALDEVTWPCENVGHAQALWAVDGGLRAGSDPRADGSFTGSSREGAGPR